MFKLRQSVFNWYKTIARKSTSAPMTSELQELERQAAAIPFAHAKLGPFFQDKPELHNQFTGDTILRSYLRRHIPSQHLPAIESDLERFGGRVATDLYDLHLQCDKELPQLEQFDAWGRRVDRLITSPAWKAMHDVSAEEGLIAIAYERKYGEWSRLYQMAKVYLFCPSAGLYSCPLAMTDGAAKIIESVKGQHPWLMERAYSRLTSRSPSEFWTSGQWMTERRGGSDVARGTETLAVSQDDGSYTLHGYKWFSSATDADMTFTLARCIDQSGNIVQGTQGLSLFYLELRDENGALNNIQPQRLKNKLGTRQVPTAELLLDGTRAAKVSAEGRGVASIAGMLTLTRLHNSMAAAGGMRRIVNLARDYSTRRHAFGNPIKNYPLHVQTLARLEVEARAATLLTLEVSRLLGRDDVGIATDEETQLMRLLTPLTKLYTGKQAMSVTSEGLECFGGQGYIEDTGLPGMLRDAQVLSIWEGTTNILSLDVLRAISKSGGSALKVYHEDIQTRLATAKDKEALKSAVERVNEALGNTVGFAGKHSELLELAARDFAYSLSKTFMGALLVEHAAADGATDMDVYAAQRWCEANLCPVITALKAGAYTGRAVDANFRMVFDGYPHPSRL
ncbi:acyl-CoA dehydrogenase family member 11-like isoform X1 [Haliotis rufescens]|uniref:acyl-CoA dehydrogenase family member 11-like isoform X1 n=1 Tax=Haliotis rufescens TaxID=6454 RepID=UPI001EB07E14|nr:acyl-CoA dehydrogenase family member 11-like isoform X1 [Haliotis rufescens]